MTFPRLHLFEFEDQIWLPGVVRDLATDYLSFIQAAFRLHRPILPLLAEVLRVTNQRRIVDLCSGGGGPVFQMQKALSAVGLSISITLTDRFPNWRAFQQIEEASEQQITFVRKSVDARFLPDRLIGLRTIFNSFHHFCESDARRILFDAVDAGQPIAIFEYTERAALIVLLTLILTPFLVALATPFIRPFRWSRVVLTYVLPLIPVMCWWDGIVSHCRAYTRDELQALTKDLGASYEWRADRIRLPYSAAYLTYLLGFRR